jgi:GH24 family phage-related lysozyme (muramidase)
MKPFWKSPKVISLRITRLLNSISGVCTRTVRFLMGDFDDRAFNRPEPEEWSVSKEYRVWLADQEGGEKHIDKKTGRWMPYPDDADKWTIGRGHLINGGRSEKGFENGLTQAQVDKLFIEDIAKHTRAAQRIFRDKWDSMSQKQRELAVDFTFNLGENARSSYPKMWGAVFRGDMATAASESGRNVEIGGKYYPAKKRNQGTLDYFFGKD